jgi:hypothetical protein
MRLRVANEQHNINLWLPLFIVWPFVLVFTLVLLPFLLLAAIIFLYRGYGKMLLQGGPLIMSCLCALRGLDVRTGQKQNGLIISIR